MNNDALIQMTADIVAAQCSSGKVAQRDIGKLIAETHDALLARTRIIRPSKGGPVLVSDNSDE